MYGANVIIFEGILTFYNPKVLSLLDMKVFVDTDADIRLCRRLKRDIEQRGRDLEGVLKQYTGMVQPSFNHYIAPTMAHADIIIPRGGENEVAIQLIVQHIHTQLQAVRFLLWFYFLYVKVCVCCVEGIQTTRGAGAASLPRRPTQTGYGAFTADDAADPRSAHFYPEQGHP